MVNFRSTSFESCLCPYFVISSRTGTFSNEILVGDRVAIGSILRRRHRYLVRATRILVGDERNVCTLRYREGGDTLGLLHMDKAF